MPQVVSITQHIQFDDGTAHHVQLFPAQCVCSCGPVPVPGPVPGPGDENGGPGDENGGPGDENGGPGDENGGTGVDLAVALAMIDQALEASGAYAQVGNPQAFLDNVMGAVFNYRDPDDNGPDSLDARRILDAAMVAYSDENGDGVADLPLLSDEVVTAFWDNLVAHGFLALIGA